jgi:hypothetical protein
MRQIAERLEPVSQHLIRAFPTDLRDEPDAARIVLKSGE